MNCSTVIAIDRPRHQTTGGTTIYLLYAGSDKVGRPYPTTDGFVSYRMPKVDGLGKGFRRARRRRTINYVCRLRAAGGWALFWPCEAGIFSNIFIPSPIMPRRRPPRPQPSACRGNGCGGAGLHLRAARGVVWAAVARHGFNCREVKRSLPAFAVHFLGALATSIWPHTDTPSRRHWHAASKTAGD
jgi:hypothetical protein